MEWKSYLYPHEYIRCISDYNFETAYSFGKRAVLYDIDNTMVPHGAPADGAMEQLFRRLKDLGYTFCAVSNNKEPRVRMFCDAVRSPYVFKAGKPSAAGYNKALEKAGVKKEQAIFFGDQIFTDILGANNAGIESVLVKPVDLSTDEIQIKLKRIVEKPFVKSFLRSKNLAITDYFG